MEGILHTFGIDSRLIIIQIFNFVLLAAALWYFLYTPVLTMLKERQEKIEKGVQDAEEAGVKLSEADAEKKEIVTAAHKEAEAIGARAKTHADEKASEIVKVAETKALGVTKAAEEKSAELKAQALKESEAEIAKLAVLAAERVMREKQS